jgi:hypothetical protein
MEILLFERASEFSHSLGQLPSPSFVASGDRTCLESGSHRAARNEPAHEPAAQGQPSCRPFRHIEPTAAALACYGAGMSLFDPVSFGPGPGDRAIERPRPRPGELRQIWRWVRAHQWPAQVVLGAVAIAAVVFVFGLLVGAGIAPMIGG